MLRYPGGISPVDLLALPLIVERLQADHPDSVLQVRSVQNDAGGATVTITVEDLEIAAMKRWPPRSRRCTGISSQSSAGSRRGEATASNRDQV